MGRLPTGRLAAVGVLVVRSMGGGYGQATT
jgi:hypothetical protein